MEIQLNRLQLTNFKIHRKFEIKPNGADISVYGDNRQGKTTLYDAFMWLLFNKNSQLKSDFTLKPIGMERPEVTVEADLVIDGQEVTMKKTLSEKWVTKRGTGDEQFSGHEIKYYVNGLERPMGDYKAFLDAYISEDAFKRLTSASYFLNLKRQDMRTLLVQMAGDYDLTDLLKDHPDLQSLVKYMTDKQFTVEDALKLAKQNISLYDAENDKISTRIDEASVSIPQEPEGGWSKVEEGLKIARERIQKVDEKLGSLHLATLESKRTAGEIETLEGNIRRYRIEQIDVANKDAIKLKSTISATESLVRDLRNQKQEATYRLNRANENLKNAKAEYLDTKKYYASVLEDIKADTDKRYERPEGGTMACELCGQTLPLDKIEEHYNEAEALFNKTKAAMLETDEKRKASLKAKGDMLAGQIKNTEERIAELQAELTDLENQEAQTEATLTDLRKQQEQTPVADAIDLSNDQTYQDMLTRLETLKQQLVAPKDDSAELIAYKKQMEGYVEKFNQILAGKSRIAEQEKRIKELAARGKELSALIAVEKKRKDQCEQLIRLRADGLSDKINSMFTMVKFRLFEQQINGGIADDCTPLVKTDNGYVELGNDASNSERINAGLDIVRAMQRYEGVTVPVFADNAEAVTKLLPMDGQVIRLVVSEADKVLRVEVDNDRRKRDEKPMVPDLPSNDFGNQIDFDSFLKG